MKNLKTKTTSLKTLLYAFIAIAVMSSISCSPEDGRDGRDGLNGINGIDGMDGAAGPQGEQGLPGEDGNTNIQASEWLQIQFDFIDPPMEYGRMHMEIENTLEFIEDGGLVMMFLKQQDPNSNIFAVTPLPYSTGPIALNYLFGDLTNTYGVEGFVFFAQFPGGDVTILENGEYTLKYVLIPANGRSSMDYTQMPYEELMDKFGLPY